MNSTLTERTPAIDVAGVHVRGVLTLPVMARGLVLFVQEVATPADLDLARAFERRGLATLRFDLSQVADLGAATLAVIDWLDRDPELAALRCGLFGIGESAAAMVTAAAQRPHAISALVVRSPRFGVAVRSLSHVHAPTLLVAGSADPSALALSRGALAELAHGALTIVPRATHTFDEPGVLDSLARLAGAWFLDHLTSRTTALAAASS